MADGLRGGIGRRLAVLIGGLPLLTGLACFTFAYLQVRRVTLQEAGQRLANAAAQLESIMRMQMRAFEIRARAVAADSALRAWIAEPVPAHAAAASRVLGEQHGRDSLSRSWQVVSLGGEMLSAGLPPFGLPTRDSLIILAAAPPGSVTVGSLRQFDSVLVYRTVVPIQDHGGVGGLLVHWRGITLSRRTGIQLRNLVGEGTRLVVGTPGAGWRTLSGLTAPPEIRPGRYGGAWIYRDSLLGSRLMAARNIRGTPWLVGLDLPLVQVREPIARFAEVMILALGVLAVIAVAAAFIQSQRLARPLHDLIGAARAMTSADYSSRVVVRGKDELAELALVFNAMAERVEGEVHARRLSEQQWHVLFASNPIPMWVYDRTTLRFLAVNQSAVACYGYSMDEFLSLTILDIRPAEDVAALKEQLAHAHPTDDLTGTYRHKSRGGAIMQMEIKSRAIEFAGREARLVLAQDVTQRVQMEAELRQAQKMEAIGRLAAGVAHDFNNVLAVIMSHSEMLRQAVGEDQAERWHTDEVLNAARHAQSLTRQLLAFSRQQVVRPQHLNPSQLVSGMERLVRPLISAQVDLRLDLDRGECAVVADPAQLEQVLLNLVINARDAMPVGGTLSISTRCERLEEPAAGLLSLPAGEYALIEVRDTGIGMSDAVQARIFEPFFTTKGEGKGTGLGLPSAYGIVKQAGGSIKVESEPDHGSAFTVYLPRALSHPAGAVPDASLPARPASSRKGGDETILLAEDESAVRAALSSMLKRLGYKLLVAADAREALDLAASHEGRIHLLISDVVMPGLTGPALLEKLRQSHPDVRVLFMSGYAGESVRDHGLSDPNVPFLEKPFTMQSLAAKVREALT